jgi:putative endopeptidase
MKKYLCLTFVLALSVAWDNPGSPQKDFVDVPGINPSIKPGDDFFRYVNGRWYDTAKIADDQSGVGSYSFLNIPQKELLQHILDSVSKSKHIPGSIDQKVGDFYASGTNPSNPH